MYTIQTVFLIEKIMITTLIFNPKPTKVHAKKGSKQIHHIYSFLHEKTKYEFDFIVTTSASKNPAPRNGNYNK